MDLGFYEKAINAMADMALVISPEGDTKLANTAASEHLGYPQDELIARPLDALFDSETAKALLALDGPRTLRRECKTASGKVLDVEIKVRPMMANGTPEAIVLTLRDVADAVRAELELRYSEQRFREMAELLPTIICEIDTKGNLTYVNELGHELLGYTAADIEPGINVFEDLVHPSDRKRALQNVASRLAGKDLPSSEYRVATKKGAYVSVLVRARMRCVKGSPVGFMMALTDLTERKKMEAQLAQADRMASIGMLAAGVAHKINNPLTYLLHNLEGIRDGLKRVCDGDVLDGQEKDVLLLMADKAIHGAWKVRDTVRDLKSFSHVDNTVVTAVSINHIIENAIAMADNEIKHRARLERDFGDLPPVMASEGGLAQVFLNLLINAARAIEEGNAENNEIRIRTWLDAGMVCIEIRDTGRPIPEEDLPRLFDPFVSPTESTDGSGLGLSICHSIVTEHEGTIEGHSSQGQGSSFVVRLPARPQPSQLPSTDEMACDRSGRPALVGRILVVDDEPLVCEAVKALLDSQHQVVAARSGVEAIKVIEQGKVFDTIVCDLMMPDMSGVDLYSWLDQNHPHLAERTVFLTGGAFTPKASKFLATVTNPWLEKPVDAKSLRAVIASMVRRSQTPA